MAVPPTQARPRPPIRVAHVVHCLRIGGLEQLVVRLCASSRERGIEPVVIALGADGPVRDLLQAERIPVEWLGDLPGLSPQLLRRIAREFGEFGVELAHCHDLGPWLNAVASRALRSRTHALATIHQTAHLNNRMRLAASAAAVFSKAVVACGSEVRAHVERWLPFGARLVTIENGVPLPGVPGEQARAECRARLGIPPGAIAIGSLGRLHHEKGTDLLLEAFLRELSDRDDVHLVIIGSGPLEEALRARAQSSGRGNIHFMGAVPQGSSLLPGLDLYAQPSRREGRSLSMLEAMAVGLPTVAFAIPAIGEVHGHEQTALLVPPEDASALGLALRRLVDDAALRARLGEAARRRAQAHSFDAMADAYASLYRELLGRAEA